MRTIARTAWLGGAALAAMTSGAWAQDTAHACFITKTDTNPFFVTMRNAAQAKAEELGVRLDTYAGRNDGDSLSQIEAVETCMLAGVDGILIVPADSAAVVPALTQARGMGMLVLALDSPTDPVDAVDATLATDNFAAGQLIGEWAKARAPDDPRIAFLDLNTSQPAVDVLRDQGFMAGFGIDPANPAVIGDETDERIVGHDVTEGAEEGGRKAMENLLQTDPNVSIVYTINEPAAFGAFEALRSVGLSDRVEIVSIDGGCPGVRAVADGEIGATSQQYPSRMAEMAVQALVDWKAEGTVPTPDEGKQIVDTGVALVTDTPVEGIDSITSAEALDLCWG